MLPDNLFEHLTLQQTFQRTWDIFWAHLRVFCPLVATMIPTGIVLVFAFIANIFIDDPNITNTQVGRLRVFLLVALFAHLVAAVLTRGARVLVVAQIYSGQEPHYCESLKEATRQFCALFCTSMLINLMTGITVIPAAALYVVVIESKNNNPSLIAVAAIVIAISTVWLLYFMVSMTSAIPVIMVENESAFGSIRQSWDLASGSRGFIFCALLLFAIAYELSALILWFVAAIVFVPLGDM